MQVKQENLKQSEPAITTELTNIPLSLKQNPWRSKRANVSHPITWNKPWEELLKPGMNNDLYRSQEVLLLPYNIMGKHCKLLSIFYNVDEG